MGSSIPYADLQRFHDHEMPQALRCIGLYPLVNGSLTLFVGN